VSPPLPVSVGGYGEAAAPPLIVPRGDGAGGVGRLELPRPEQGLNTTAGGVQPPRAIPSAGADPVLIGFLVTFQNEPTGKFWPLRSGRTTIGRRGVDGEADVAIGDPSASARHALIQGDPSTGQAFIEDLGSRNGTFVNEQKMNQGVQRQLHDNDRVRLGSITLVVKLLAS
jgi:pSer/pThr/pTyr-binding forkhead associated (FHA) protein